ncbi:DUF805 domain-containing protein [Nonlabens marinus]|uniref:Integral membrane protein n=1 Tax=Nonlabens marinus S1-08 TaxID=1454201 RepID=W8VS35_9FLAO|nr:DUF805 domain-containing protein [Nonlabens marinus]BAO56639.1 integral membrane protein [Nonlabens marinus S1-08]
MFFARFRESVIPIKHLKTKNVMQEPVGNRNKPIDYPQDNTVKADGMMDYVKTCFNKYADFSGRARRSEYWYFQLFNVLAVMVIYVPIIAFGVADSNLVFGPAILLVLYLLATIIPSLAVAVRRLHDTGRSGWFYLINFIPLVGGIIMIIFFVEDSKPGTNQWGPNPKGIGNEDFDEDAFR